MSLSQLVPEPAANVLAQLKTQVSRIRERAKDVFEKGASGVQVASVVSDATDEFIVSLLNSAAQQLTTDIREMILAHGVVIAVGGSGRAELCPYSDTDLLFLYRKPAGVAFDEFSGGIVRDCWDAGLKLGHSQRTLSGAVGMGKTEPQFATALVEARYLWGSESFFQRFKRVVDRKVIFNRRKAFINACLAGRSEEREEQGDTVNRLEPDLKKSLGGLRDIHLIRWIGYACHGTAEIDSLKNRGALTSEDAQRLAEAHNFLTTLRVDLHFSHARADDVFIRDEQLRIAEKRGIEGDAGQRPVEKLMQTYFLHTGNVADISQRFVDRNAPGSIWHRVLERVVGHTINGYCRLTPNGVDVVPQKRQEVCSSLEEILKLCHYAMQYGTGLAPLMVDAIQQAAPLLPDEVSDEAASLFRKMLRLHGRLGSMLRTLFRTRILDILIPDVTRVRGLLQFNQYHSYTVDEHTFRAIEACEKLQHDDSSAGTAYRNVRHKATLHLALIMHDLGKGFDEDHSDVGRRIAMRIASRLGLSDHKREMAELLVHQHLKMSHLAFRRDISDPQVVMQFAHDVGSPEVLRMLYVLTVSDVTAVGPGTWNDWKADLLADLYDSTFMVLSGEHAQFRGEQRLARAKEHVRSAVAPVGDGFDDGGWREWIDEQLEAFPPHYFANESADRIARDLDIIQRLSPDEIIVEGSNNRETGTVDFRVIAGGNHADGCFHKLAGVLSAKRLEILAAQISTSRDGVVVDGFQVRDTDFAGEAPESRIEEVRAAVQSVLRDKQSVEDLFRGSRRIGDSANAKPISGQDTRVVIDAESSDRCTIIDVFAHDQPGLLYTISRQLYEAGLSVWLAKIATNLDQVADVFYVTDGAGRKITEGDRLRALRDSLQTCIEGFARLDS